MSTLLLHVPRLPACFHPRCLTFPTDHHHHHLSLPFFLTSRLLTNWISIGMAAVSPVTSRLSKAQSLRIQTAIAHTRRPDKKKRKEIIITDHKTSSVVNDQRGVNPSSVSSSSSSYLWLALSLSLYSANYLGIRTIAGHEK